MKEGVMPGNLWNKNRHKRTDTMFQRLLWPMLFMLLVDIGILFASLVVSDVVRVLNRNAVELVDRQVTNRRDYMEGSMVYSWSDLSLLSTDINAMVRNAVKNGTVTLDALGSDSTAAAPLLEPMMEELVTTLYSKRVTGIFVMFSTDALPEKGTDCAGKPGLYIRDLDPDSAPSVRRSDLLLERAPIAVVQEMNISTDSYWKPLFTFSEDETELYECIKTPYDAARSSQEIRDTSDFGRWSIEPYKLSGSAQECMAYVQPLVLEDGTVYGVIGVELMTGYINTKLPYDELADEELGSYLLGVSQRENGTFTVNTVSGPARRYITQGQEMSFSLDTDGKGQTEINGQTYFVWGKPFVTYSSNTPFESEQWMLVGLVPEKELYAFSGRMKGLIEIAILCMIIIGVLSVLAVSRGLSKPVSRLHKEVEQAKHNRKGNSIPQLSRTGIREIDSFADSFVDLSQEIVDASSRFLKIMRMTSLEIGGFEIRKKDEQVFVTDNFFPLFEIEVEGKFEDLTIVDFRKYLEQIRTTILHTEESGYTLYHVRLKNGDSRYLRMEESIDDKSHVGLIEDVTVSVKERIRIEKERDYDLLTGLLSRRAFYRMMDDLFLKPARLGHAALVMFDLDNLKQTNDRFGHDWGDKYIRQAGQCFRNSVPEDTLCARVSGDEFYLFFYGYESQEAIREKLDILRGGIKNNTLQLPNGETAHVSATGGVAWYPEDTEQFSELMSYADFAMYQVKHKKKGSLADFDLGVYNREHYRIQRRREFQYMILHDNSVNYHFQPIVSAKTGKAEAYEALMRVNMATIRSPLDVMEVAKEESQLAAVERMTWKRALGCYQNLLDENMVDPKAKLFVNSIASVQLNKANEEAIFAEFGDIMDRVVVELTEMETLDEKAMQAKRDAIGSVGMFALDDYGSGYNSEINLLEINPMFVKVDTTIIRDIDTNKDKQQIVSNIVAYAHERGMYIVAEGIETVTELMCVINLGVDLLQGYFLARPAQVPGEISQAAVEVIQALQAEKKEV